MEEKKPEQDKPAESVEAAISQKVQEKEPEKPLTKTEKEKHKLLNLSEVSLILDTYDDIFSDFDPRPYAERALSDDFLVEARKATRGKSTGEIEINFMVPHNKRNHQQEAVIKKRLKDHFRRHHQLVKSEMDGMVRQGVAFTLAGIFIMFLASMLIYINRAESLAYDFMLILLEPAGWFLFWEGMSMAIFESKKKRPDVDFEEKMAKCWISFTGY